MKSARSVKLSILITVASLLLPFKVTAGNEIHFGYPFMYVTVFKSAFNSVNAGWHSTVLQLIGINLFTFCLDVAAIYIVIFALEKIRKSNQS